MAERNVLAHSEQIAPVVFLSPAAVKVGVEGAAGAMGVAAVSVVDGAMGEELAAVRGMAVWQSGHQSSVLIQSGTVTVRPHFGFGHL
jgi:hypothetical protein